MSFLALAVVSLVYLHLGGVALGLTFGRLGVSLHKGKSGMR